MRYIYKRKILLFMLIAASLLSVRLLSGCGEGLSILTEDDSSTLIWSEWSYRRSVTITNAGSAQSAYQVNVILHSGNFTFANADANGNDIRFNYNGDSIPYWIENWDSGGGAASVWVKIPSIPNGNTVIYLYYGKTGETAASDFDNTFTKDSGLTGLVARWHMDEGSGSSTIGDSSSNSNNGTITGAAWVGTDGGGWFDRDDTGFSSGASLSFDGTDDFVTVADDDTLDLNQLTIAGWINTSDDVTNTQFIIAKWDETLGNERSFALSISGGQFYFWTSPDGDSISQHSLVKGGAVADNCYHITATSDGINKRLYINGSELTPAAAWASSIHSGLSNVTLGRRIHATTQNYFKGIIDEISIYNRALSPDEVKALSQRRKYSADVGDPPVVGGEEMVP